jgi:uncharacterized membrane protein YoaK (UPF0700 family)
MLLSVGAGVMDALSFLQLGHVFTSAMTGNAALLGLAIGQLRGTAALRALSAFAGFALGAAAAALILRRDASPRWLAAAFVAEAAFLAAFGVLWVVADRNASVPAHALILLSAFGMGVQGSTVRHFEIPGVTTTVFTTTLLTIVTAVLPRLTGRSGRLPHGTWQQIGVLVAYASGAAVAGIAVLHGVGLVAFLPLAAVLIVLARHFLEQ